jgi:uncharacterized membrane protein (UPF0136 family)
MSDRRRNTRAGGAILALSILVGTIVGIAMRQSSIGVIAGVAIGVLLLLVIWLMDRR